MVGDASVRSSRPPCPDVRGSDDRPTGEGEDEGPAGGVPLLRGDGHRDPVAGSGVQVGGDPAAGTRLPAERVSRHPHRAGAERG